MKSEYVPLDQMHGLSPRKPGLFGWFANLFTSKTPAPDPAELARLIGFCKAMAQYGGVASDGSALLEQFGDVQARAERLGLAYSGSGWDAAIRLTEAGWRLSGETSRS